MNVGPEAEFFIFKKDEKGNPTLNTNDKAGYYDAAPTDKGENLRRSIVKTLKAMGFEVEASHHEVARGQHEIDFKYDDALTAADNIMTFKYVVCAIAEQYNYVATFMPKPIYGINGLGMHCNLSIFKNGSYHDACNYSMLRSEFINREPLSKSQKIKKMVEIAKRIKREEQ